MYKFNVTVIFMKGIYNHNKDCRKIEIYTKNKTKKVKGKKVKFVLNFFIPKEYKKLF